MNDSIVCLLDTNSIIKYYHNEAGSDLIKYLFDQSPNAQINITNLSIPEVVYVFHLLHLKKIIPKKDERDAVIDTFLIDIRDGKILPYEYKESHLPETFNTFNISFSTPVPFKRPTFLNWHGRRVKEGKEPADVIDVAILVVMKEIQSIIGESYLFTSDGHVIDIAKNMNLSVYDPEKITLKDLPFSLDRRSAKRKNIKLKIICKDRSTGTCIGSLHTKDISCLGACISYDKNIEQGKALDLEIIDPSSKNTVKIGARVAWSTENEFGVNFDKEIDAFYLK